ncbi:MAG: nucleotide exchange factor GrpE [Coriobacteriales bacterium]|jgi:molecular chaperone GrpE|nr:nucleotide exchange factor GrpE [Coriobacteriales bacterium]
MAAGRKDEGAAAPSQANDNSEVAAEDLQAVAEGIVEELAEEIDELAQAKAEREELRDRFLRLQAEWDNFRKRTAAERAEERNRATEHLVEKLLPVVDDLERALEHAGAGGGAAGSAAAAGKGGGTTGNAVNGGATAASAKAASSSTSAGAATAAFDADAFITGIQAVQSKLAQVLEKEGVQVIDPLGEPFDANAHSAVGTVASAEQPEETVAEVYQKGYRMGSRLLRPAMVVVTKR